MRVLPEALAVSLASGVTTLCRCWELKRDDGKVMGFTDHDRDLSFGGVLFKADSGLNAAAVEMATGLSVDTHSVTGAIRSDAIDEAEVERGLYDSAEVTLWMVDWMDVASRLLLSRGFIGEIRRQGGHFEAEIVGLAERLNQPFGRAYLHSCDARLGDERCGIALDAPEWRAEAVVDEVLSPQRYAVTGLDGFESGFFANGSVVWMAGANAGAQSHVKHYTRGARVTVDLWLAPPVAVAPGDILELTAGCDKTTETCRQKFLNFNNFRGFPHMPGDDWAVGYPDEGGAHDGGSLFRS